MKRLAKHQAQLVAHFVAQLGIALGFGGLTLQRVHLPRDFVEDVVDARQVLLGVGKPGLGEALASLELGDAGGFFDDVAAIRGLAAQNLPDASLLDERVGLWAEAGAHEDVLDIAQAAELAVELILAFPGSEQPPGDDNLAFAVVRLKFTPANLKHDLRSAYACVRFCHVPRHALRRLGPRHARSFRDRPRLARPMGGRRQENSDRPCPLKFRPAIPRGGWRKCWPLLGLAGANLFDVLFDLFGAGLSLGRLVPIASGCRAYRREFRSPAPRPARLHKRQDR